MSLIVDPYVTVLRERYYATSCYKIFSARRALTPPPLKARQADAETLNLAASSGGYVTFDLKRTSPTLSLTLSGVANQRTYANFRMVAEAYPASRRRRVNLHLLAAVDAQYTLK
jgi:hypothetical protein